MCNMEWRTGTNTLQVQVERNKINFCKAEILIKTANTEQSQAESLFLFNTIWSGLSVGMSFATVQLTALTSVVEGSCFYAAVSVVIE